MVYSVVTECPHCGQPMTVRFGVKLPPKKAEFLDMIEQVTKGRGGIELESLASVFYPGVSKTVAKQRAKVHICQINDLLLSTDYRIVNRDGLYRLVEQAEAA